MKLNLIAPCGIDCSTCKFHLREKNPCQGCRGPNEGKPKTRTECKIKTCENLKGKKFCSECKSFPCEKIKHLDKRSCEKYNVSVIENLKRIKND